MEMVRGDSVPLTGERGLAVASEGNKEPVGGDAETDAMSNPDAENLTIGSG